jgi:hypothetical protein
MVNLQADQTRLDHPANRLKEKEKLSCPLATKQRKLAQSEEKVCLCRMPTPTEALHRVLLRPQVMEPFHSPSLPLFQTVVV